MRKHHVLTAAVSLPVLLSALALAGCTVGAAAGIVPPVTDETEDYAGWDRHPGTFKPADAPTSEGATTPTWTVVVAGQADNLHSPEFAADLAAMTKASTGAHVKIVVSADFNGGLVDAKKNAFFATGSQVITIGDGNVSIVRGEEQDSDDPTVLKNAITNAFQANPADHHAVIIWSRGVTDATHILGGDTQNSTRAESKGMNVSDMQTAIRSGLAAAGINAAHPLDVLGFDTSSAGRVEDAYAMRDLAKVYIANASADGGRGWAYQEAFGFLGSHPSATAADFAKAENDAWQNAASSDGRAARAHVAFDTGKLENLARATDSFVQATQIVTSSLPHVASAASLATIDAGGMNRRPDFKRFFDGVVASRTNMGIVTTAAQNASDVYASAFIGTPSAAGFTIGLPSPGDLTNGWYNDYLGASTEWFAASRWNFMLAAWSSAQDRTPFSIQTSIEDAIGSAPFDDDSDSNPSQSPATIKIGSENAKVQGGMISAALVLKSGGNKIAYGSIANGRFGNTNASLSWSKRVAVVDGQPARAILWTTPEGVKTAVTGRVSLSGGVFDAAVMTDHPGSFILSSESHEAFVFSGASIVAIDPTATFTPSYSQNDLVGGDTYSVYGSPITITEAGVPISTTEMGSGNYEVQITAQDAWGISSYATQPYFVHTN